jgi:hypothetical protein
VETLLELNQAEPENSLENEEAVVNPAT